MYGGIIGDVCGSIYEWNNRKTDRPEEIELVNQNCYYTDDTILTVAIADGLLTDKDYRKALLTWSRKYSQSGYGGKYREWFNKKNPKPYNSYGNGSAMRVGPVGWCFDSLEETRIEAKKSALVTHNHKEGIKGAEAAASAIYLARTGKSKTEIKEYIETEFKYNLSKDLNFYRGHNRYFGTCQGTVPPAIMAFLESKNFENTIQIAISLGGDTDTLACIAGSISDAFYQNIPFPLIDFVNHKIKDDMMDTIKRFYKKYMLNYRTDVSKFFDKKIELYI